ncbi:MAG: hypothetical protein RLZZ458_3443, partial [Planctomycetota bacterium]
DGGDGGNVTIVSEGGEIAVGGIFTRGGDDTAGSRRGGDAGAILIETATGANINIDNGSSLAVISAAGGQGGTSGSGGSITFSGPVVLKDKLQIELGPQNGSITFEGSLDSGTAGSRGIEIFGGSGNVNLMSDAGIGATLGQFTIHSAANVDLQNLKVEGLQQLAGTGTTHLHGEVRATTDAGIDLSGTNLVVEKLLLTQADGQVRIDIDGTATFQPLGDILSDGDVSVAAQQGIVTAGDVITSGDDVAFLSAIRLSDDVLIRTSGSSAGTIRFDSTVDLSGKALKLDAGGQGSIHAQSAIAGNGDFIVENAQEIRLRELDVRFVDVQQNGALALFAGPVTVRANAPGSGSSAFKIRSAGQVNLGDSVKAIAAGDLNIDVRAESILVNGSVTATGEIDLRTTASLAIAAVNVTADSDSANGGKLFLQADSDLQRGGDFSAAAGSTLTGAAVDLSGAQVLSGKTTAQTGDVRITTGGSAVLDGVTTSTTGSVIVKAGLDLFIQEAITVAGNAELRADADANGTGLIKQTAGNIQAAAGVFSAAEGINGSGSPGQPAGVTVRLGTLSASNTGSGDLRIVQSADGGNLSVTLIENPNAAVVLHVLNGSLIDDNGQSTNINANSAEIYLTGGSVGTGSTDIFRGIFDPFEVRVATQLIISAPDGFVAVSGDFGGAITLTAESAVLQSGGDINLSSTAPVIAANLAVISGGRVTTPDSGLAVTGDLRLEALTTSSATAGNSVVLGTAMSRTDRLLLKVTDSENIHLRIHSDQIDVTSQRILQMSLNGATQFVDLDFDLKALNNPNQLTVVESDGTVISQGPGRGTDVGTSMNDRLVSDRLLLLGSSTYEFVNPDNAIGVLAADVGGPLRLVNSATLKIDALSSVLLGRNASGVATQNAEILLKSTLGDLDIQRHLSSGSANLGLSAAENIFQA